MTIEREIAAVLREKLNWPTLDTVKQVARLAPLVRQMAEEYNKQFLNLMASGFVDELGVTEAVTEAWRRTLKALKEGT